MPLNLNDRECRVIGCLMEKSVTTPDQYPLTLNALTNACNQKSSRDPVMSLSSGEVEHTVRELEAKSLIMVEQNFSRGVDKFKHRFCNTRYSELQFDQAQYAIVCLLLLRGPQTPGEIRARSGRLHEFDDNGDVVTSLNALIDRDDPMLVKLPRTPGRKDSEYMHLFSGPIDIEAYQAEVGPSSPRGSSGRSHVNELEQRLSELEAEVEALKRRLDDVGG